jgi:glycosyltransferase involved in cell wall biosynthesis
VLDDGSTDNTEEIVRKWSESSKDENIRVIYRKQQNKGRGYALLEAIRAASGRFLMVMDSDDEFLPDWLSKVSRGLELIGDTSKKVADRRPILGLIFNCLDEANAVVGSELPTTGFCSNFLALRADLGVKGDKKEVVVRHYVLVAIEQFLFEERRLPTSLLWGAIAERGDCLVVNESIVRKFYLPRGMTSRLPRLKFASPKGMREYNCLVMKSRVFKSRSFRLKAAVQFVRYSLICGQVPRLETGLLVFSFIPGVLLSIMDRIRFLGRHSRP